MNIYFEAAQRRVEREHNDRAWLAWHTAALQRRKKFPTLKSMMHIYKRRQTWQEQFNIMARIPGVMTHYPEKAHG